MKRRHLILLLGGASSGAMSIGTGAFSSVEAKRGVAVNVVEDENAYLGLQQNRTVVPVDKDASPGEEGNGRNGFLTVTNQFTAPLALGVTLNGAEGDFEGIEIDVEDPIEKGEDLRDEIPDGDGGLDPGHSASIGVDFGDIDLDKNNTGTATITLGFYGNAGGTTVEQTRRFTVSPIRVDFKENNGVGSESNDSGGGAVHIYGSLVTFRCTSTVTQKVSPSLPPMDRTFSNRAGPVAELPG